MADTEKLEDVEKSILEFETRSDFNEQMENFRNSIKDDKF